MMHARHFGATTVDGHSQPHMTIPESEQKSRDVEIPAISDVVSLLASRVGATADLVGATVAIAVSEARLAMSSAGMMAAFSIMLLVMLPITWLVMLATLFQALLAMGMTPLTAMLLLLLSQLLLCGLLVWAVYRLSGNLSFVRTRQALSDLTPSPVDDAAPPSS